MQCPFVKTCNHYPCCRHLVLFIRQLFCCRNARGLRLLDDTVLPCEVIGDPKDLQIVWSHGLGPTDPRAMHRESCESFPLIRDSVAASSDGGLPFSAVLFDARGHGKSSGWEPMASCIQQFHWRSLAFDMLTVASHFRHLPARKHRGALLGGFSMGASTAIWAAHLCPTMVRGLVLFSVNNCLGDQGSSPFIFAKMCGKVGGY